MKEVKIMGSRRGIPNKKESKYDTDILSRLSDIKDWIATGNSVRDICKKLSVSPDSWYRYCKEHETLSELVNMGKSLLNQDVEKSLFKLCNGYEYEELKTIVEEDRSGKKRTRIEKTKKQGLSTKLCLKLFLIGRYDQSIMT
jgi:predicted transcriptional regulator